MFAYLYYISEYDGKPPQHSGYSPFIGSYLVDCVVSNRSSRSFVSQC